MTKLRISSCAALLFLAVASTALAAESSWTGTWKEDLTKNKSSLVVSYTPKGSGFHFSNGSTIAYDFACDGKTYPTYTNQSITCKTNGDGSIDWNTMENGKLVLEIKRTFSADGKTMTMNELIHNSDGTTSKSVVVRSRKSGTTGLGGEWVNAKITDVDPDIMTISTKGDWYHMQHDHSDAVLDIKFDGTEAKPVGKEVHPGASVIYKQASPGKVQTTTKLDGKVMSEGVLTLNPDGKTMVVESWLPGKESQKSVVTYVRQ